VTIQQDNLSFLNLQKSFNTQRSDYGFHSRTQIKNPETEATLIGKPFREILQAIFMCG
jgi:hypothetical protein